MSDDQEITRLRQQVEQLNAANEALRDGGFRGSKAEALMALEYDRIPNVLKTPRAIRIQRKIATAVMVIVPLLLVAIAVAVGINAYHDHERSVEAHKAFDKLDDAFQKDPAFRPQR